MPTPIIGNVQRNWKGLNHELDDCGKLCMAMFITIVLFFFLVGAFCLASHTIEHWEPISACWMDKASPICVEFKAAQKAQTERSNYLRRTRCVIGEDGRRECYTNLQLERQKRMLELLEEQEKNNFKVN